MAAIVLGLGRAIGETMAVILVAGNSLIVPTSLNGQCTTVNNKYCIRNGLCFGTHQEMLFATGIVLFSFILILNFVLTK